MFMEEGVNLCRVGEEGRGGRERVHGERGCMERGIERERGRGRGRGKEEKWPCRGAGIVVQSSQAQGGTSLVSVSNISMVTGLFRGSFSFGPKILGKYLQ